MQSPQQGSDDNPVEPSWKPWSLSSEDIIWFWTYIQGIGQHYGNLWLDATGFELQVFALRLLGPKNGKDVLVDYL